jgi:hypothetical protein
MANDPSDTLHLMERLRAGDRQALTDLFQHHRDRLRRMVDLRMGARLQARVDVSDVLQDAFLNAAARLDGYGRPGWDRGSERGQNGLWANKPRGVRGKKCVNVRRERCRISRGNHAAR